MTTHAADSLLNGLELVSEELDGKSKDDRGTVRPRHVRNFPEGLWGMIKENSLSRVFLGVHWSFDGFVSAANGAVDLTKNIGGVPLGVHIAEDVFGGGPAQRLKKSNV